MPGKQGTRRTRVHEYSPAPLTARANVVTARPPEALYISDGTILGRHISSALFRVSRVRFAFEFRFVPNELLRLSTASTETLPDVLPLYLRASILQEYVGAVNAAIYHLKCALFSIFSGPGYHFSHLKHFFPFRAFCLVRAGGRRLLRLSGFIGLLFWRIWNADSINKLDWNLIVNFRNIWSSEKIGIWNFGMKIKNIEFRNIFCMKHSDGDKHCSK